jgi:hypothetical protein
MKKGFPIISLSDISHVGTMDKSKKEKGSYEGSGLSVSTEPKAWVRINPFTGGTTFRLTKKDNKFLSYHDLTVDQKEEIKVWGAIEGYITLCPIYTFSYEDDEFEVDMCMYFTDREEAVVEADGYGIEESEVEELQGFTSNPMMDERVMSHGRTTMDMQLLSTLYAEDVLQVDGVWWEDILDVSRYSAPRGVIFEEKLKEWTIKKV